MGTAHNTHISLTGESVLRTLGSWVVDYVRWSQMVPMIFIWLFMLFGLAGMTLVNFQEQSVNVIFKAMDFWESQSWLPRFEEDHPASVTTEEGSIHLDTDDFSAIAFKIWAALSLVFLILDLVRRRLFGPPGPPNLKRQLLLAGLFAAALFAGYLLNYLFGSEEFNDGPIGWLTLFTGFALIAWLVSAYSLIVNALLRRLSLAIDPPGHPEQNPGV